MSRWFRFYDDAINDPKILKLTDRQYRVWVGLLCAASKNDGILPPFDDLALMLRMRPERLQPELEALIVAGLFDHSDIGIEPHNWKTRQYKSDVSTDRVKRFRNGKRNVSETSPDTETEPEDRIVDARARGRSSLTDGSKALADAIWKALGVETPLAIPPELAGVDWRAVSWEAEGWTPDLVDAVARRIGPGKPITYYEKAFASEYAKRNAPLPKVEIQAQETIHVAANAPRPARGSALTEIIDRKLADAHERSGRLEGNQNPPRLLSNG